MTTTADVVEPTSDRRAVIQWVVLPRIGEILYLDGWPRCRVQDVQHVVDRLHCQQTITIIVAVDE